MELNGALSNPRLRLEGSLERLLALRKPAARSVVERDVAAPPRPGRVARTVTEVLLRADAPMRAREVHRACEALLGGPVSWSTVKDCLSEHSSGVRPRFSRVDYGRYELLRRPQTTG